MQYQNDEELVNAVLGNTKRYMSLFAAAADAVMPIPTVLHGGSDMFDIIAESVRAFVFIMPSVNPPIAYHSVSNCPLQSRAS